MGHGTDTDPGRRLSDCVTSLLRDHPFFGSLVLRMPLVADPSRKTLASDGLTVRYKPRVGERQPPRTSSGPRWPVSRSPAASSTTRAGASATPSAGSAPPSTSPHGLLRDAGFTLPAKAQAWDGLSVEQAYERLSETTKDEGSKGTPPPGGSSRKPQPAALSARRRRGTRPQDRRGCAERWQSARR